MTDFGVWAMWGLDFSRAVMGRSSIYKLLLRLVLGKYAFRELCGLMEAINKDGYPVGEYGCKGCDYHKDKAKPFLWWREYHARR